MIRYKFANIRVMGMPNIMDVRNPYIIGNDVRHIINVSENPWPEDISASLAQKGIERHHFPLSEDFGTDWRENLGKALSVLSDIVSRDECVVVHCGCGNNRSRTVVESLYYVMTGLMYEDEYKGFPNHLLYNIDQMHFSLDDIAKQSM